MGDLVHWQLLLLKELLPVVVMEKVQFMFLLVEMVVHVVTIVIMMDGLIGVIQSQLRL